MWMQWCWGRKPGAAGGTEAEDEDNPRNVAAALSQAQRWWRVHVTFRMKACDFSDNCSSPLSNMDLTCVGQLHPDIFSVVNITVLTNDPWLVEPTDADMEADCELYSE